MDPGNHALVSVVTPFYNSEKFLPECIESVLAQSYQHWEYILLDNCSSDNSLLVAKRYAEHDRRIRVIEATEFVGQIANYNRVLRSISSTSKYTKVVEADNWLYSDCLEKMVSVADENPTVGVVSAYNITEYVVRFHGARYKQSVYDGRDAARLYLLESAYMFGAPTTVLIRSDEIRARESFFPEDGIYAEDLRICFDILRTADFAFVHDVLTFVRTNNDSILSRIKKFDAMTLDRFVIAKSLGSHFLSAEESKQAIRRARIRQYNCVATGLLVGKGRKFWQFHRNGMIAIGEPVNYARLVLHVLMVVATWILNPGHSVAAIFRRLRAAIRQEI